MTSPEIREQLKLIQQELKKPFPAPLHEVRELPGTDKKWVFLRWQTIRERLDEVCPDWIIDYSEVQYLGNDAICRCGITILGVRKEAIASVPVSVVSSKGKEMTRGSAADRLAAEALKNSSEAWGVGRYLDDQEFTIRYLWERKHELDDQMVGEVRKLAVQYRIEKGMVAPRNEKPASRLITEAQAKRLWAIARSELKLEDNVIKSVYKAYGFEKTELITADKYEQIIAELRQAANRANNQAITTPTIDRNLVISEIDSLMKRRSISTDEAKAKVQEWFGVGSRQQLTDKQLIELRDRFSVVVS